MSQYPTAQEISATYDFNGKWVIVTGASSGIGVETARVFAMKGAHVIMACRSPEKSQSALQTILNSIGQDKAHLLELAQLDLASISSVRKFSKTIEDRGIALDLLINNAGVFSLKGERTNDGFETNLGVNHLTTSLLTLLLIPALKRAGQKNPSSPARVVFVSSAAHTFVTDPIDFDDFKLEKEGYQPMTLYAMSKLYIIMFANELNRRLAAIQANVICNSIHPGVIVTEITREMDPDTTKNLYSSLSEKAGVPIFSIEQGAATTFLAAGGKEGEKGGVYFADMKVTQPSASALDQVSQKRLWEETLKALGMEEPSL